MSGPLRRRAEQARGRAGQLDLRALAEVKLLDEAVQGLLAEAIGDLGDADVGGGGEDLVIVSHSAAWASWITLRGVYCQRPFSQ